MMGSFLMQQEPDPSSTGTQKLTKWKCRNPKCRRVLMEQAVVVGLVVKICERCGTVNVLRDGVAQV